MSQALVDQIGRRIRKLRVSLTDACNFRCFYCMPEESEFMATEKLLQPNEIFSIVSKLCRFGVEEIRLTGGEPTVRREFREIVENLSDLPIKKLGLTTNGLLLGKHLDFLKGTACQHINVSLDSLNAEKFDRITRRKAFVPVMAALMRAKELNFPVKINAVLMHGINEDELVAFAEFSEKYQIPVRFLELMRIGQACNSQDERFMTAAEAIAVLREKMELRPIVSPIDSTSFNFATGKGGQIGFIASESQPFCGTCSRWRLTADGHLRACLMSEQGVLVRGMNERDYPHMFQTLFKMKPTGRIYEIRQDMNQIGG